MDRSILNYLEIGLLVLAAAAFVVYFVLVEYRNHKRSSAPVETARAVAYYKHPDMETMTVRTSVGLRNESTHYITFHTESGDILRLYMTDKDFYAIPEGSWGMLTWQHNKFWKFEKED